MLYGKIHWDKDRFSPKSTHSSYYYSSVGALCALFFQQPVAFSYLYFARLVFLPPVLVYMDLIWFLLVASIFYTIGLFLVGYPSPVRLLSSDRSSSTDLFAILLVFNYSRDNFGLIFAKCLFNQRLLGFGNETPREIHLLKN